MLGRTKLVEYILNVVLEQVIRCPPPRASLAARAAGPHVSARTRACGLPAQALRSNSLLVRHCLSASGAQATSCCATCLPSRARASCKACAPEKDCCLVTVFARALALGAESELDMATLDDGKLLSGCHGPILGGAAAMRRRAAVAGACGCALVTVLVLCMAGTERGEAGLCFVCSYVISTPADADSTARGTQTQDLTRSCRS